MKRIMFVALGFLLVGSLVAATHPFWGILFFTSFEGCHYKADQPLVGQNGWVGLDTPDAFKVVKGWHEARCGRKAVCCLGGDLEAMEPPNEWLLSTACEKLVEFDPPQSPAVVYVQADVRLLGPDTGTGPGDDLLSLNFMARNAKELGAGRAPWFYLSSNGCAYANAWDNGVATYYKFETPIKFGKWNTLAMVLNYKTHMCTFEVNHRAIGSLPFGGPGEQFTSVLLEMCAWNHPSFDATAYKASVDNILVLTWPAR